MIYEHATNNEDTPILVSANNGKTQFIMYRKEKKNDKLNIKLIIVTALNVLFDMVLYIIESIFVGMKGLKK